MLFRKFFQSSKELIFFQFFHFNAIMAQTIWGTSSNKSPSIFYLNFFMIKKKSSGSFRVPNLEIYYFEVLVRI